MLSISARKVAAMPATPRAINVPCARRRRRRSHRVVEESNLAADVLVPQRWILADEFGHHLDALGVGAIDDLDALGTKELRAGAAGAAAAGEVDGFADDDALDAELNHGTAAQEAGHQGRVKNGVAVAALAAGPREAVDLGVGHRVAMLHAAVVAAGDDLAIADEHRADRQAAFGQPQLRL